MSARNRIDLRFAEDQMQSIRRAANAAGLAPSTFVRLLALRALADRERDDGLAKIAREQREYFAEILKRLLQFRLMSVDRKTPEDAKALAAGEVARFIEALATGTPAPGKGRG